MTTHKVIPPWSGSITLPDPAEFTGAMAQTWRRALAKKRAIDLKDLSRSEMFGVALVDTIAAHLDEGMAWDIEGVPLEMAQEWVDQYYKAPIQLMAWAGRVAVAYIGEVFDPNG